MISKGRTSFRAVTESYAEAINNVLTFVPEKLEQLRKETECAYGSVEEEYEEWDDELQRNIKRIWRQEADTSFVDEALDIIYTGLVVRVYSFAENGLVELTGGAKRPKPAKGERTPSDLDLYYRLLTTKYPVLPEKIDDLWPTKKNFHNLRKSVTHYGKTHLNENDVSILCVSVNEILLMLLKIEEVIMSGKFVDTNS